MSAADLSFATARLVVWPDAKAIHEPVVLSCGGSALRTGSR